MLVLVFMKHQYEYDGHGHDLDMYIDMDMDMDTPVNMSMDPCKGTWTRTRKWRLTRTRTPDINNVVPVFLPVFRRSINLRRKNSDFAEVQKFSSVDTIPDGTYSKIMRIKLSCVKGTRREIL